MRVNRAAYYLVRENSQLANATGLHAGDVLAVADDGSATVLRQIGHGPPVGPRARLAAEGTLQPLAPVA